MLTPLVMAQDVTFPAEHGFKAHTPDPTKYHNIGGRNIIPRSSGTYENHTSRGFHHEQKGLVFIDPQDPISGFGATAVIDFRSLTDAQVQTALRRAPTDLDTRERTAAVMESICEMQRAKPGTKQAAAPPVASTTPVAAPTPAPVPATAFIPQLSIVSDDPPPPTVRVTTTTVPPSPSPTMPVQDGPNWEQLAKLLLSQLGTPTVVTTTTAAPFVQEEPVAATAAQDQFTFDQLKESLQLPFLSQEWQQPAVPVTFITPSGVIRACYHEVMRRDRCVTLVVDMRQESPLLFVPAPSDDEMKPIRVVCEARSIDERVINLNFHNQLGCFELYNLVVLEPSNESPND